MKELPGNRFAIYTASGRIIALLCNFAMPLFLTRFLAKVDYGLYSQFYTVVTFVSCIFSLGIQSNLYYFFPNSDDTKRKNLIVSTFLMLVIQGIVASLLFFIPGITDFFIKDAALHQYIKYIALCVLFFIPTYAMVPLFVTRSDKVTSIIYPPLEVILKIIAVLVASWRFGTLESIFAACIICHFLLFSFAFIYVLCSSEMRCKGPLIEWETIKQMLIYVAPFGLSIVLETLLRQFDRILCISYISPEEYAVYALAFFGIPGIYQVYDSVQEVNLLNMARSYKEGRIADTLETYKTFTYKLISFSLPIILIVCLYADDIITFLFSVRYSESAFYFRIYLMTFIVGAFGASVILRATGRTNLTLRSFVISTLIYLPVAFLSIRYFGLKGAITSAVLGVFLPKFTLMCFEKKILQSTWRKYLPWKKMAYIAVISILCLIPFYLLKFIVSNIFLEAVFALLYILTTYYLEIRASVFIVDADSISNKIKFFPSLFK